MPGPEPMPGNATFPPLCLYLQPGSHLKRSVKTPDFQWRKLKLEKLGDLSKVMMASKWQGEVWATISKRGFPGGGGQARAMACTSALFGPHSPSKKTEYSPPFKEPTHPSVISGFSEPSLDLVAGRAELSGGWPLCQGHTPQSISSARLYAGCQLLLDLHAVESVTPALIPADTGSRAPGSPPGHMLLAHLGLRACRWGPRSARIAHRGVLLGPGMCTYVVPRPAACMRGELTLARCLLPPISPIKNILPSRSARSSPGPQLYFINTFRQVQKGMIHAGPEHSSTPALRSLCTGKAS